MNDNPNSINLDNITSLTTSEAPYRRIPMDMTDGTCMNWLALWGCLVAVDEQPPEKFLQATGLSIGRNKKNKSQKKADELYETYRGAVDFWEDGNSIEILEVLVEELLEYGKAGYKFDEIEDGCLIIKRNGGKDYASGK